MKNDREKDEQVRLKHDDMIQIGLYWRETYVCIMQTCVPTISLVWKSIPIYAIVTEIEFVA